MKKTSALTITFVCFLSVVIVMSGIRLADGYSETETLWAHGVGGFSICELEAGDRLEMSFSLANMGPYIAMVPEMNIIATREAYYSVNLSFTLGPEKIVNFDNTRGDSFSYTALKSGIYSIGYRCEGGYGFVDAKDPVITIKYEIIKAETSTPNTPAPTPSSTMHPTSFYNSTSNFFGSLYCWHLICPLINRYSFNGAVF